MSTYSAPGVYVQEVPSAIKPITGVGTSMAAFLGIAQAATAPKLCTNFSQYQTLFMPPISAPQTITISGAAASGSITLVFKEKQAMIDWDADAAAVQNALQVLPTIGSGHVSVTGGPGPNQPWVVEFKGKLAEQKQPAITIGSNDLKDSGGNQTPTVKVKVGAAPPPTFDHLTAAVYGFFQNGGTTCYVVNFESGKITDALTALAKIPGISIVAAPGLTDATTLDALKTFCEPTTPNGGTDTTNGACFAVLDGPETVADDWKPPESSDYAAIYAPWIEVANPFDSNIKVKVPPCGHVAGIYARVDAQRGVHKAPANEVVLGALGLTQPISSIDQGLLNPNGLNCIRSIGGAIMVWGARTLAGPDDPDLKYVNVRRTLIFLRESIELGVGWVVFEPNDSSLWAKITRNVSAFLTGVWQQGALFGDKPEEAFYVKCDAETNPQNLVDLGQVTTEVGVAIVRPAEFVVFTISQWAGPGS